jgi:hypothetical protein
MGIRRLSSLALPALAMSVGWGFRGDYGHEAGAMVPGALVALAACLTSGRPDWWGRASLLAMLGGVGWAFGGSMSYGLVVGYTAHSSFLDVAYGYACLFIIGALWGGIGAGVLALGVTRPRSELERFAAPLAALYAVWLALDWSGWTAWLNRRYPLHDTDWVAASSALAVAAAGAAIPRCRRACLLIGLLAAGWWAGFGGLTLLLGLRMTPPRGDNWAGCAGLLAALVGWLLATRNRAALLLLCYGALAGGVGFAAGDFLQMLGRAGWGPIGRYEALQGLGYWKWMEQCFGLIMGFGVGLGFARLSRDGLAPPVEDEPNGPLRTVALVFLLVVMMWVNLHKNVRTWARGGLLQEGLLGLEPQAWFLIVGVLLSAAVLVAIARHRTAGLALVPASAFGRGQLLFLLILWVAVVAALLQALPGIGRKGPLFVHATFWLTATLCTLVVVCLPAEARAVSQGEPATALVWRPGWRLAILWGCVPALILLLAYLTCSTHEEPLPGSRQRFGVKAGPRHAPAARTFPLAAVSPPHPSQTRQSA